MKQLLSLLLGLTVALTLFGAAGCQTGNNKKTATPSDATEDHAATPEDAAEEFPLEAQGFALSDVYAYSGPYVEDGSNEEVVNVAAVRVENRTGQPVRYVEFSVSTGAGALHFTCTTLLPGRTAVLLETDRASFTGSAAYGVRVDSVAWFDESPTLYPDTFSLSVSGHVMTLRNLTSRAVPGEIYVYFKRTQGKDYLGGITYRVRFADLAAGAEASVSSQNLSVNDCDIIFIGCENPPEAAQ